MFHWKGFPANYWAGSVIGGLAGFHFRFVIERTPKPVQQKQRLLAVHNFSIHKPAAVV